MNALKPHLQTTLRTLLERRASQREIERVTGIDRKTIRSYEKRLAAERANSPGVATGLAEQIPPPRPPAPTAAGSVSSCEPHRAFIEEQLRRRLGHPRQAAMAVRESARSLRQPHTDTILEGSS